MAKEVSVYQEFYNNAIVNLGVKYSAKLLAERTRAMIRTADDNQKVTDEDVAQVLTEAMAKHLDPLKGGLYAFKDKDNRLVIGTSKRGFQQSLCSQPNYAGNTFIHEPEQPLVKKVTTKFGTKEIKYYESSKCIIRKIMPNGSVATFEGTAYFDEEFNASNAAWVKSPRRLLDGRALCIATSNAYGWGAYDAEEAGRAMGFNVETDPNTGDVISVDAEISDAPEKTTGASRANKALNKVERKAEQMAENLGLKAVDLTEARSKLVADLTACKNREDLVKVFTDAPKELQKDQDVINACREIAKTLENNK